MWSEYLIRFLYAITFVSIGVVYYLTKRQQRVLKDAVDEFAFAFVKIADSVIPGQTGKRIAPDALQAAMKRAVGEPVIALYHELEEANHKVARACGRSKKMKEQFAAPLQDMFDMTRAFLIFCEKSGEPQMPGHKKLVNRYLYRQPEHRRELLRRVSQKARAEFCDMNAAFNV